MSEQLSRNCHQSHERGQRARQLLRTMISVNLSDGSVGEFSSSTLFRSLPPNLLAMNAAAEFADRCLRTACLLRAPLETQVRLKGRAVKPPRAINSFENYGGVSLSAQCTDALQDTFICRRPSRRTVLGYQPCPVPRDRPQKQSSRQQYHRLPHVQTPAEPTQNY